MTGTDIDQALAAAIAARRTSAPQDGTLAGIVEAVVVTDPTDEAAIHGATVRVLAAVRHQVLALGVQMGSFTGGRLEVSRMSALRGTELLESIRSDAEASGQAGQARFVGDRSATSLLVDLAEHPDAVLVIAMVGVDHLAYAAALS